MRLLFLFTIGLVGVALGVRVFLIVAERYKIVDCANNRSLHEGVIPRGAGLVIGLFVISDGLYSIAEYPTEVLTLSILLGAGVVGVTIGLLDDIYQLRASLRLVVQLIAVGGGIYFFFELHEYATAVKAALMLFFIISIVWIINVCNFMDGADGLLSSQIAIVAISYSAILSLSNNPSGAIQDLLVILGGGCVGFLRWNWQPAKIFLGDSGSYFIGFTIAGILVVTQIAHIPWAPLIVLLAPLVTDATLTTFRRLTLRERWWEAHRSHLYQLYIRSGYSHRTVAIAFAMILGIVFIPLAYLSQSYSAIKLPIVILSYGISSAIWLFGFLRVINIAICDRKID